MLFLGHSTVRIEIGGRVVLTDPVLTPRVGPLIRVAPPLAPSAWAGVDLVLISHQHGDHLHLPSLRLVSQARIVVPRGAGAWLRRKGFPHVDELGIGESLKDGDLTVTAVPAHHSGHRWGPRLTHGPHAPAVGHILEAEKRIYVAGDTDLYEGMADLGPVDVAFLPVWGWGMTLGPGHLDPLRAAKAVDLVKPRLAVPVHWGTLALPGLARTPRMRRLLAEPGHEFAAAVRNCRVVVTPPGTEVMHEPSA
ncbi:MBL fold metallo-hydrolase [Kibdelosporangium aridum]|uniref:MBL fold metallo-hydrolase n=1 Tax=Kibdelosporangium aridum TaxID=2030 RepID=A0A428Z8K9_KIBAR|nr:MBL fold metallo-hydrolase [Kibdelosporangium aridum]RSM84330.1 MBL fold metallo-hydrolase [Kibdelosporangium aridum]